MGRIHNFITRIRSVLLVLVLATGQVVVASGPFINNLAKASASPTCVVDTAGANDEPGQKDLTKLCVDYAGVPTTVATTWQWDETGTSGANTMDACSLFDTDGDGNINYSVCVTTHDDPATLQTVTTYSCGDDKTDRCTSPVAPVSSGTTSCSVTQVNTDPFPSGASYNKDTQGSCTVQLSTVGGASAKLIDVCSYPSEQPNSDPSDCVIAQPKAGKLEVVKNLVPSTDAGLFNLQVDGTTKASNVGNNGTTGEVVVPEGNHSVGETAGTNTTLGGYTSSISCRDLNGTGAVVASGSGTSLANVPIPDGSDVVCTITNTASGSITIVKDAIPNDAQDFGFTATGTGVSNFSLDDDNGAVGSDNTLSNTKVFSNLAAGSYTFTEGATSGWDFDNISCSQGASVQKNGASVTINLTAGQNVNCTYTNRKRGTITVHKVTNPANDPTQFSITASGTGTIAGNATRTITTAQDVVYDVAQGTYSVSEQVPAGWAQTGNTCSNLVVNSTTLSASCTITNTKYATLTIVKDALPNDSQDFGFTTTGLGGATFNLDDDSDPTLSNTQTFTNLLPGSYSVGENATPGWSLTGLTCNTNNFTTLNAAVTVNLAAGQTTTCTFINTKLVSISGTKYTSSATGVVGPVLAGWTIFIDANGNGVLDNGEISTVTDASGNYSFTNLMPGTFTLNEVLMSGWTQIFGPQSFSLNAGQNATSKDFGNFQNGGISGFKWNDLNGNGVFDNGEPKLAGWTINLYRDSADADNVPDQLVGTTVTDANGNYNFSNLSPLPNRYYAVCEVQQSGWVQTFPAANACHNIEMDQSGETNTNTNFGNQGRGTIRVIKNVDTDGNGTVDAQDVTNWTWNLNGNGSFATGSANAQPVAAGTYTVSEVQKTNFHVVSVVCDTQVNAVSTSAQVVVGPGSNVTCTFTNARDTGNLTLVKHVVNNNGGTAVASNFTLHVTQNGSDVVGSPAAGSEAGTVYNLPTGQYAVSENTPVTGYQQTSIVCDGQTTNTVTLTTGTNKVCTITNDDIAPQLTVIKHVINDNSGTKSAGNFVMNVTGTNVAPLASFPGSETGVTVTLNAGSYSVNETPDAGYTASLSAGCTGTIALGQTKTCTITNNDVPHPGIHVVKSGPAVAHEGDVVVYTFTVTNTGDTSLSGLTVNDSIAGGGVYQSGDTNGNGKLDLTETWVYTKQYTIPTPRVADVTNTVTVCAVDPDQTQVCDTDDHRLDVLHPSIDVIKYGPPLAYEGQIVGYTFKVTNTGDTTLFNVNVSDDIATNETCDSTTLTPGAFTMCSAIYLIPIPTNTNVVNTVTASGTDVLNRTVTDQDNHTLDVIHPSINVVKSGPATAHAGDTVTYTFTVTNTGDIPLSSVTVNDNVAGGAVYQSGDTNGNTQLDLTETWIFTKDYTIPKEQVNDVVNTATACGYDPIQAAKEAGKVATCDTDTHTLDVLHPSLNVVKSGPASANPGDTVTYTFTVTNTGDTPLSGLTASDSIAGNGVYQSGDTNDNDMLDLTETWVFTVDYTIPTTQDSNIDNTVTVCGSDSLEEQTCDTDDHHLVVLATVIVTKFNDYNRNGVFDEAQTELVEPALADWQINLDSTAQSTGANGTTTFTSVTPDELHTLSETQQTGWNLSNIYCDNNRVILEEVENEQVLADTLTLSTTPGATVHCFVGNYQNLVLNLTKSNNRPNPTAVGDTVTYTLVVTLPTTSGASFDTTVIDLPPNGFTYVLGSWTANSSVRGDIKALGITTEPTYGSPGEWLLGNMIPGEVVTLTYQAKIASTVSPGTYPDVAFAQGCATVPVEGCGDVVYSNLSTADDPFVSTTVSIKAPQVLGASVTVLVNTGTADIWRNMLAAIILMFMTVATLVFRQKKGGAQ